MEEIDRWFLLDADGCLARHEIVLLAPVVSVSIEDLAIRLPTRPFPSPLEVGLQVLVARPGHESVGIGGVAVVQEARS